MTQEKQKAFESIKDKRPSMRSRILEAIKYYVNLGMTTSDLSSALNMKIQTVSGRLDELQDEGLVYAVDRGGTTFYYYEPDSERQKIQARKRAKVKLFRDIKKLRKRYKGIISEDTFDRLLKEAKEGFDAED